MHDDVSLIPISSVQINAARSILLQLMSLIISEHAALLILNVFGIIQSFDLLLYFGL